ncbi:MAG: hypothetical protein A2284_19270 [Deltaproteobacteria bacterium RIFOXYA12_FULL_61_11]|nr:MAG: hypothetical protein A2284_19270 [Deltaproteobacteria bacterium RIFOXYA12_FULL_61_11]
MTTSDVALEGAGLRPREGDDPAELVLGGKLCRPMLMPYDKRSVPHCVIEVNQACNISCRACYKDRHGSTKPLEQIKAELDLIVSERRVSAISLAGGEPTLHPQLPEIIAYAKSKGVVVQMLSNGLLLTDELLAACKRAGLSTIYLHLDSHQHRPDIPKGANEADLDELRLAFARRINAQGLFCSLNVTLYQDNLPQLAHVVRFLCTNPSYHRMLVTCCTDFDAMIARYRGTGGEGVLDRRSGGSDLAGQEVGLDEVAPYLYERLGMEPFGYIASTRSLAAKKWLFYFSFTIALPDGSTRVLHTTDRFKNFLRFAQWFSMKVRGTYPSGRVANGGKAVLACLIYCLTCLDLRLMGRTLAFLSTLLRPGARIFQKSFIFQGGPSLAPSGELEYCQNCPDATVRDGVVVPLCTADYLDAKVKNSARFLM